MRNRQPRMSDSATRQRHSTRQLTIDELKAAMVGRWPDAFYDAASVTPESLDGRGHSCPRCGGNDRFAAFKDVAERGSVQCRICFNSETDPKPGDGIATLRWLLACDTTTACRWLAGWLGWSRSVHRPDPPPLRRFVRLEQSTANDRELGAMATRCHEALPQAWWSKLEALLSLPAAELIRLRVGWSKDHKATTWPMVDHDDNVSVFVCGA